MKKIYDLMTKENCNKITQEIIITFIKEANQHNVDYEWTIKEGTGKVSNRQSNTFFYFDTKENTALDNFKKALFNEDLADIEEGSKEEQELMDDVNIFLQKICKNITEFHFNDLREVIRKVVLGNKSDLHAIPLDDIQILSIDIADFSSVPEPSKYLLRIGKRPDTDIDTGKITQFVQEKEEETGEDINTIVEIEKQAGNLLFKDILTIEKGRKYLNEISLYMFVDYSLAEEIMEK